MAKDAIKNIDIRRDDNLVDQRRLNSVAKMKEVQLDRIPSGTTTHTFLTNKLAKSGKLDRANIETKELPRNKTDYVSYEPPTNTRPQQKVYDLMMTKPKYGNNMQSSNKWMPYDNAMQYKT